MSVKSNSANGAMLSPHATMIETASGLFVDVANPDPETIRLEDIAQGLALTCRYGGHVARFYSVAEHAVLVHDLAKWLFPATEGYLKAALFHDAPEAYLGDVVAPLKYALRRGQQLSEYDVLDGAMLAAIASRFDLDMGAMGLQSLRMVDMWALRIEAAALTSSGGGTWRWEGTLPNRGELPAEVHWAGGLSPESARDLWLKRVAEVAL